MSETYTPEELSHLVLRCVVCAGPVPDARSRRRKDTCSVECYDKLKQWRKHLQATRKCPSCLAPYTEKQRAEFRRWRQAEGSLRTAKGIPPGRERIMGDAIRAAVAELNGTDYLELLQTLNAALTWAPKPKKGRTPKPVDTTPPERDSISASHIEA